MDFLILAKKEKKISIDQKQCASQSHLKEIVEKENVVELKWNPIREILILNMWSCVMVIWYYTHTHEYTIFHTDNWLSRLPNNVCVSVSFITMILLVLISPILICPWCHMSHCFALMCLSLPFTQFLKTIIMCYCLLPSQYIVKCSCFSCSPFDSSSAQVNHFLFLSALP